jgi:thiosulfate dehydrogenase
MRRGWTWFVVGLTCATYTSAILLGLRAKDLSYLTESHRSVPMMAWTPPPRSSIPSGQRGDSIRFGESVFDETPLYAARYSGAKISCSSCHAEGGIEPYASPMVGLPALFPMFNARAGHVISLKDRI